MGVPMGESFGVVLVDMAVVGLCCGGVGRQEGVRRGERGDE